MPKVYLAGPITGLSYKESTEWRDIAAQELSYAGIEAYSPLRFKSYLAQYKSMPHTSNYPLSTARGMFTRDYNDCMRADVILVNLKGAKTVSIGTVMEIAWAKAFNKPVVLLTDEDCNNIHEHPLINECVGFRVFKLEDAIEMVKAVLLP